MASNKPRLYLALYARLKHPETYHYALHISPKSSASSSSSDALPTKKYHCKNILQLSADNTISTPWTYVAESIDPATDARLLVRVYLGKLICAAPTYQESVVEQCFQNVQIKQDDPGFNCVEWVKLAVRALMVAGLVDLGAKGDGQGKKWRMRIGSGRDGGAERAFEEIWEEIRRVALGFVKRKKWEGRWEIGWEGDRSKVATWDWKTGRELVP